MRLIVTSLFICLLMQAQSSTRVLLSYQVRSASNEPLASGLLGLNPDRSVSATPDGLGQWISKFVSWDKDKDLPKDCDLQIRLASATADANSVKVETFQLKLRPDGTYGGTYTLAARDASGKEVTKSTGLVIANQIVLDALK